MSKSNRKTHGRTARVERAGVLHCARVVNEMKHVWRERPISDVGIDGDIEIVEPATETPTGRFLLVQVKARSAVDQDASGNLKFRCTAADLEYWLNVGVPVLLVIVDVEASQAWFKNVHEWFNGDIARRRSRNVVFHPTEDRFDASAADRLVGWAVAESGLYMGPAPQPETLFSNLLAVEHRSDSVFVAPTKVRRWRDANDRLREAGLPPVHDIAWRDGLLWSFRPLDRPPLIHLVEGAMDRLATDELETSHADDDQRLLVRLLGGTLKELHRSDLREDERHRYLYFRATQDLAAWRIKVGQRGGKGREVFGPRLDQETGTRPVYYRHSAVEHQFLLLEEGWFLALNPTYHYTRDGQRPSRFAADYLKGIKKLEGHEAVRSSVRFWADYFRGDVNLFAEPDQRLRFGLLANVDVDHGIDDRSWGKLPQEGPKAEPQAGSLLALHEEAS